MRIALARPPNYDDILAAFPFIAGRLVIFAFGDTIYNPAGIRIPPEIIAHERVHGARQGNDPQGWWQRYIADREFRLAEELPAHRAEYQTWCQGRGRHDRRRILAIVAQKLASPVYGRMISAAAAKAAIKGDAE